MRSTVLAFLLLSARGGVAALAAWLVCRALRRAHAPSRLLCWLWLAVGLRFVLPWGIPLKLPRPESAPLAAAADTVQELGELPLLPPAPAAAAAAAPAVTAVAATIPTQIATMLKVFQKLLHEPPVTTSSSFSVSSRSAVSFAALSRNCSMSLLESCSYSSKDSEQYFLNAA